jgi:DNA-directed RNA polymerase specialized sigma24 family protein
MYGLTLTEYERCALDVVQLENRAYKHHYYLQKPLEQIARELGVSVRKVRAMCNRANLRRRDTHDLKG